MWLRFYSADLINMFLYSYCDTNCALGVATFYSGQQAVQTCLLLLAVICIPIMLFPKPFLLKRQHEGKQVGWSACIDCPRASR